MANDVVIKVEGVSKKFCRSLKRSLVYGLEDVARDVVGIRRGSNGLRRDEFWALNDISFEVRRGECLGIIGLNGAGKSTLLKMLNGLILPDKGAIKIRGRVGGLLEIGAGFHPTLSGRENIYLSGAVLGLSKGEIDKKFDDIVDFAELWDFIDAPVKNYSSGMYVRLGFAVAVHTEPDILSIDEALAVGDVLFQAKCYSKLREFKEQGITIIFVTHSLDLITTHCSHALLLDKGLLIVEGAPKTAVDEYNRLIVLRRGLDAETGLDGNNSSTQPPPSKEIEWRGLFRVNPNEDRYGTKKAEILEAGIFTLEHKPVQILQRNQKYLIKVKVRHHEDMPAAIVAYTIKDPKGTILCGTNTLFQNIDMGRMGKDDVIVVTFRQPIRLNPGDYLLCIGSASYEEGEYVVYDRRYDYMPFQVVSNEPRVGLFDVESVIEWIQGN
ncbi:MAG: ABC transporter ATP-binding protein [Deltaproteobacteria bacterium]|nr:ABC transporter ATP-binding protein [Deltaproteobacteria bacterium]